MTETPRSFWHWIALGGGLGLLPKAPGTWGSVPGVALGCAFVFFTQQESLGLRVGLACAVLIPLALVAWYSIHIYERDTKQHDDSRVVIDEVAGQAIATMALPFGIKYALLSFGLFRLFDIVKKGPVGYIDRNVTGAWGTLADDLMAGVMAAAIGLVLTVWI